VSPLTCDKFPFSHDGINVVGEQDMCHPCFILFGVTLVGSTCPNGISILVLTISCWHANISYILQFYDDNIVIDTVKTYVGVSYLHFFDDDIDLDIRH